MDHKIPSIAREVRLQPRSSKASVPSQSRSDLAPKLPSELWLKIVTEVQLWPEGAEKWTALKVMADVGLASDTDETLSGHWMQGQHDLHPVWIPRSELDYLSDVVTELGSHVGYWAVSSTDYPSPFDGIEGADVVEVYWRLSSSHQ